MTNTNKKYYHSSAKVEDILFPKVYGYDLTVYRPIIKKFNASTSTSEKENIAEQLPSELFCTCRFCGKKVITAKSKIDIHKDGSINSDTPSVKYRIINGRKYELSCCEYCLLDHFKDNPPKSSKYYFMKANKFGAYSYGYGYDEYKRITSMTVGVTEKSMIKKWGKEEGLKRWKKYCDKHSYIASKDAYINKYGKKEGLSKYYNDRAMTKELCIKRHGQEKGIVMWKKYCDRQRYTCSKEYYIKKYGKEEGINKWKENRIIFAKAGQSTNGTTISTISQELFSSIYERIKDKKEIYYGNLNKEYELVCDNGSCYFLDFYDKKRNIVIEFNGDYWHANPLLYKSGSFVNVHGQQKLVDELWKYENIRKQNICKQLNNPIYIVVWESDYRKNKKAIIEKLLKYFK